MDKYPKFILVDDVLILSKVKYHKDILRDTIDLETEKSRIKGGGWFTFNAQNNTFVFNGDSHDFGKASVENIQKAIDGGKVFSNIYQSHSIADEHNFAYRTETELIPLKQLKYCLCQYEQENNLPITKRCLEPCGNQTKT